jgi:protein-S-isoprenylcysteine O-methyltransferase Ste14
MATLRRSVVVSMLFTVFGGPGFILVYLPFWITRFHIPASEPAWQTVVAAALIIAGLTPLLDSIRRFIYVGRGTLMPVVPTEHLVVSGLYRYVRNPMYLGVLTAVAGEVVLFWSRDMAIYALLVALGFHIFVWLYEEPTLARRHPEGYPRYLRHVPRWVPRLTPWQDSDAG